MFVCLHVCVCLRARVCLAWYDVTKVPEGELAVGLVKKRKASTTSDVAQLEPLEKPYKHLLS